MKMSMEYPCVYFEKDGKCRRFSDDTVINYFVMGPCPEQKRSNADRIRAMSDEELAKFLSSIYGSGTNDGNMRDGFIWGVDWLRQPAEED